MKALLLALTLLAPGARAAEPDRSRPVPPSAERPFGMPAQAAAVSSNGLRLTATEVKNLPIVAIRMVIPAASAARASLMFPQVEGIASMTAGLLDENTRLRDGKSFSLALENLGASFSVSAGADALTVSVFAMKDSLDAAMALAAEALLAPSFRQDDVERYKLQMISSIREQTGSPDAAASKRLSTRVYGAHPYAARATEATVSALDAAAVASYHGRAYRPEGASIHAAGELSLDELKSLAERHFGAWGAAAVPGLRSTREIPQIPTPDSSAVAEGPGLIDLIDMGDSPQSVIMVGQTALPRRHRDRHVLMVLNAILGGSQGRLDANLRESRSWSYGAYSSVEAARDGGMLVLEAPVQTDKTAESVSELLREMRRLRDEDAPEAELAAAKKVLIGRSLRALETVQSIAGIRADAELHDLGPDALAETRDALQAVTAADVRRAAAAYLRPDAAAIVVAGDAAKVKSALEKLRPVRVIGAAG